MPEALKARSGDAQESLAGPIAASILVVDDEPSVREGCRRVLCRKEYRVEAAAGGREGLAKAKQDHFDLILIDIKMPDMDGVELLQAVRNLDPDTVCVIITGYATLELAVRTTKLGAYDFVTKPLTPNELLGVVERGLEVRRLTLETRSLAEERDRRLLEIAAEKSRLRTIIDCLTDGVLVINRERQLVLYNPAILTLLSLKEAPRLGQPFEQYLADPEMVTLLAQSLSFPDSQYSQVAREFLLGPEGKTVAMANVAAVRDESGQLLGAVLVLRDITQLKELDRMKAQFIAMVAHELRAPLAAIKGYLDLILGDTVRDPAQIRHMLQRCNERGEALLALIQDLLEVSRLEAARTSRRIESLPLTDILQTALELVSPQAQTRKISISCELPAELPLLQADREEMIRLFTNLLTNAIKYNRPEGKVWVQAKVEGPYVRIDISDTGVGIPKEALPKLFREFFRLRTPETKHVTGTGLGLSIVKKIVDAHGGRVEVISELGKGSTFTTYLPIPGQVDNSA
jgi:PAS domain S-box-containing protein